jgi:hypothetical protein
MIRGGVGDGAARSKSWPAGTAETPKEGEGIGVSARRGWVPQWKRRGENTGKVPVLLGSHRRGGMAVQALGDLPFSRSLTIWAMASTR